MELRERLRKEEGYRTHLYEDSEGVISIGIGYNIDEKGLPRDIIERLFEREVLSAVRDAENIHQYHDLNEVRQGVLVAMVYQLGLPNVSRFHKLGKALDAKDYETAADEMLDSRWHRQTPGRCEREAELMRRGTY